MADQSKKFFFKHIVRKIFLEDWALKLTALVITLALWLGVTGLSTPTTKRLTVPLNLSISSDAQIVNVPQQELDIEISGDKRRIDQINRSELTATLDLTDVLPGDRVVSLSPDNVFVTLPQGIKLVEVAPSRIAVNLEAVEEKEVEVKVQAKGDPAPGYEVYTSSALPQRIRVRGPASIIKMLDFVQTDVIDITGKKEEFIARQVPVSAPNPKAAVLNTVVDVVFRLGEKRVERTFTLPVSGLPGKIAAFTIFGPGTLMQKAKADEFKIEMILNERGENVPQVTLPAEFQGVAETRKVTIK
ncbi:MAG: YbbR-like domain-containing protein [Pyrinomonadaceae bacterium]